MANTTPRFHGGMVAQSDYCDVSLDGTPLDCESWYLNIRHPSSVLPASKSLQETLVIKRA